ncbi:MAG: hypothetical protein UHN41_00305 [Bacteroidales bacterium]|nr:hypothetical protein [Bacteroidales bacterium]
MKKMFKTLFTVTNGKDIGKNLAFGTYDEAIVLVLCNINSNKDHVNTSDRFILMLLSTGPMRCNLVLNKPSGGI